MLMHPSIDPVALQIGPLAIHWYGLTYLAAFGLFFLLARRRLKHQPYAAIRTPAPWSVRDVEDLLFLGVMGVVLGGRLGYCLFYKPAYYAAHPLEILALWQGGMSFHGGLLRVLVSRWWFARSRGRPWLQVMDLIAPCVPTGLAAGRLGNFINGELWGRQSDVSWAMVFPQDALHLPRHPSQLYQIVLEGGVLFALLWWYSSTPRPRFAVGGLFMIGYGVQRFIVEFFREPDAQLQFVMFNWMTRGQQLSIPMVVVGIAIMLWAYRQPAGQRNA